MHKFERRKWLSGTGKLSLQVVCLEKSLSRKWSHVSPMLLDEEFTEH